MPVGTFGTFHNKPTKTAIYVECFYDKEMTLADIARRHEVSEATVRELVTNYNPKAYCQEQKRRSVKRQQARREKDRIEKKAKRSHKRKRKQKYIEEDKEAWEWLQLHFQKVFPFKKRSGVPDAELAWFCCAQTGFDKALKSPHTTNDIKAAIRSAQRTYPRQIEVLDDITPLGCSKSGNQGGKSDRTARISMLK